MAKLTRVDFLTKASHYLSQQNFPFLYQAANAALALGDTRATYYLCEYHHHKLHEIGRMGATGNMTSEATNFLVMYRLSDYFKTDMRYSKFKSFFQNLLSKTQKEIQEELQESVSALVKGYTSYLQKAQTKYSEKTAVDFGTSQTAVKTMIIEVRTSKTPESLKSSDTDPESLESDTSLPSSYAYASSSSSSSYGMSSSTQSPTWSAPPPPSYPYGPPSSPYAPPPSSYKPLSKGGPPPPSKMKAPSSYNQPEQSSLGGHPLKAAIALLPGVPKHSSEFSVSPKPLEMSTPLLQPSYGPPSYPYAPPPPSSYKPSSKGAPPPPIKMSTSSPSQYYQHHEPPPLQQDGVSMAGEQSLWSKICCCFGWGKGSEG